MPVTIQDICVYDSPYDANTDARVCFEVKTGLAQYWGSDQFIKDQIILWQYGVPVVPVRVSF